MKRVIVVVLFAFGVLVSAASLASAATCNVSSVSVTPNNSGNVRLTVSVNWQGSGGCTSGNTYKVEVIRGSSTVLASSASANGSNAGSVTWNTASGGFADGAWTAKVTPLGTGANNPAQVGVVVDNTAPVITFQTLAPVPNANGWNNANVSATWSCADATSGPVATTVAAGPLTADTANGALSATCMDIAGNSASNTKTGIKLDKTAPAIALTSRTPANGAGWNNWNVSLTWSCSDALSGAAAASATQTVSSEGANQASTGTCADLAGNTASNTQTAINIDKTAPTIAFGSRTEPNANGWNNTDVTVTWTCSDSLSGTSAGTSVTLTTEGEDQQPTGSCTDAAGNIASDTVTGINIDRTAPSISYAGQTPAANAAGWNNGDVTLSWTCEDALSGPVDQTVTADVTGEGLGLSGEGTCADLAGNSASDGHGGIAIDRTQPTISFDGQSPARNAAGWNNTDVTVTWACSDALSGAVAPTVSTVVGDEGTGLEASATCSDAAGNQASDSYAGLNIDETPPSISFVSRAPSANDAGWNRTDVNISWTCDDGLSGVLHGDVAETVSTEGFDQTVTGSCADNAGNTATNEQSGINIDTTAPSIALESRTPANDAGWNNTDIALAWSCSDDLSGVVSSSDGAVVSSEGLGQQATGSCADAAGNAVSDTVSDLNVDKSAPEIAYIGQSPPANAHGWNDGDVTLSWLCTDAVSGVVSASTETVVTGEGAGLAGSGECADRAGNTASDTRGDIDIDRTAPAISFAGQSPAPNAAGWNNDDVVLSWTCADALSGAADATVSTTIATEGDDLSAPGECGDLAGNTATDVHAGVKIDKTAPAISFAGQTPPPNAAGWNNTDVLVSWSCVDQLSGPTAAGVSQTLSTPGANQSASGACEDVAGNRANDTVHGINIDKTGATAVVDQTSIVNGVLLPGANVTGRAQDDLSGVASISVTFTDVLGARTTRLATCTGCGTSSATWSVSTDGLLPGPYTISAVATDVADNAGVASPGLAIRTL